jgi:hypothetical protein
MPVTNQTAKDYISNNNKISVISGNMQLKKKTSNNTTHWLTQSGVITFFIPVLGILIAALLVYMVWDIATRPIQSTATEEGFTNSNKQSNKQSNNLGKLSKSMRANKNSQNSKSKNWSPGQSKLSAMKKRKYNFNDDFKNYGMDADPNTNGKEADEDEAANNGLTYDSKLEKQMSKLGSDLGTDALNQMMSKRANGKRDNFKNVINEVDSINPGAFDLTSIGGTIRRYNENFNNRLNYAKAKNEGDNLEATMAQGKVIFDEFKKIFLFTDMFR